MPWNWELPEWPNFSCDFKQIALQEREFLLRVGRECASLKNISEEDQKKFAVEILSLEGLQSSKIEGEILDRESLQSSIKRHFGISDREKKRDPESRMAHLLYDVYQTFNQPLTHEMLWQWHLRLFNGESHIEDHGKYRTHAEPMQIVANRYGSKRVFFEAPPSLKVFKEMEAFITWFNAEGRLEPILGRAAIAHVYFESIHPFEDGNGRIGRFLVEKVLSQGVGAPILIASSKILERRKKEYYAHLERCNKTLEVTLWVEFFADVVLEAQEESLKLLLFLIEKSRLLTALAGQLNPRQEKVLLRMFAEGTEGFQGGLSAENYISITKTSRATATRDLSDLVEKRALVKTGKLRHTRYMLNVP